MSELERTRRRGRGLLCAGQGEQGQCHRPPEGDQGLFATDDEETREEAAVLDEWLELSNREAGLKKS